MRRILTLLILGAFFLVPMLLSGCDSGLKINTDDLKETLFRVGIDWAITAVDNELGGDNTEDRIEWVTDKLEGWLSPLGVLNEPGADGWEEVIARAYGIVEMHLNSTLKKKLKDLYPDTWEEYYEGATRWPRR